MKITRRRILGAAAASCLTPNVEAMAGEPLCPSTIAARLPWMSNAVALTADNTMFVGLPRFPGPEHANTPSVAIRRADGTMEPFPGGHWNAWTPGNDGVDAFVYVNAVHIFADDTLWCVDMGSTYWEVARPGAAKYVQIDPRSGKILRVIRLPREIAPPGTKLNDLRIDGDWLYGTDSGLGAIIVHNLRTGLTMRRLAGYPQMMANPLRMPPKRPGVKHKIPEVDLIEVSPDGEMLYVASPAGPFYHVPTRLLRDRTLSDADIARELRMAPYTQLATGTAMDTRGNLYLADPVGRRMLLRGPKGRQVTIAAGAEFASPDAMLISSDRHLYVPLTQGGRTTLLTGKPDVTKPPFLILALPMPSSFDRIAVGNALTLA